MVRIGPITIIKSGISQGDETGDIANYCAGDISPKDSDG